MVIARRVTLSEVALMSLGSRTNGVSHDPSAAADGLCGVPPPASETLSGYPRWRGWTEGGQSGFANRGVPCGAAALRPQGESDAKTLASIARIDAGRMPLRSMHHRSSTPRTSPRRLNGRQQQAALCAARAFEAVYLGRCRTCDLPVQPRPHARHFRRAGPRTKVRAQLASRKPDAKVPDWVSLTAHRSRHPLPTHSQTVTKERYPLPRVPEPVSPQSALYP